MGAALNYDEWVTFQDECESFAIKPPPGACSQKVAIILGAPIKPELVDPRVRSYPLLVTMPLSHWTEVMELWDDLAAYYGLDDP